MEQQERQEALETGEKIGSETLASGAASTDQEPETKVDVVAVVPQPVVSEEEDDITKDTYRSFESFLAERRGPTAATLLNAAQECQLSKWVKSGEREGSSEFARRRAQLAREELVRSNLRLVTSIAKKYQNRGIAMEDLIQEGTLGLIHAVDKYDHRKGFRFSTYATHWIRQALGRAVTREMLATKLNRQPTSAEIATEINLPVDKVDTLLEAETPEPMSLDAPAGDSTTRLGDLLPAEDATHPSSRVFRRALREELEHALSSLTPREKEVLELRYGLHPDAEAQMTLEQVGRQLQLSRERARQIESGALAKLRRQEVGSRLRDTVYT
jgi:RNA polymerase sigma factor (sigma-70 family)